MRARAPPARAALALALALLAGDHFGAWCAGVEPATATSAADDEDDDEGDSAPFTVVVRHADGRACGAALVTLRTALSSAACARGARELWAVAPAAGAAAASRRVLRVALAAGGDGPAPAVAGDPWAGADGDLALLELAAPLPSAVAILMATDPGDCEPPQSCNLVRLAPSAGGAARLRIVDARLDDGGACAARGPRWAALRARTLCLAGPELCREDRGTGVVCGGKLCGVVSRSAGAPGERCGDAHAAANVPRWRRFLHCAHTRGSCGRDGDCAHLCSERWLVEAPPELAAATLRPAPAAAAPAPSPAPPPPPAAPSPEPARRTPSVDALQLGVETTKVPPRTTRVFPSGAGGPEAAPPRTEPAPGAGSASPAACSPRGAFEFEPNRADFRMSASTRVFLKAGEYGDNAAEYAAPDDAAAAGAPPPTAGAPPPTASATPPTPSRTPGPASQPAAGERAARPEQRAERAPDASRAAGARPAARRFSFASILVLYILYSLFTI